MLPLYSRIGMSPRIMAGLIILAGGVMNMTPWGGPTARAASALHVDPSDIFVPMIPAMAAGVLAILVIAYFYGKRERARLGELHLIGDEIDHSEISVSQFPDARLPDLVHLPYLRPEGTLTRPFRCRLFWLLHISYRTTLPAQQRIASAAHAVSVLAVVGLILRASSPYPDRHRMSCESKSLLALIPIPRPVPGVITALVTAFHLLPVQRCVLLWCVASAARACQPLRLLRWKCPCSMSSPVHLLRPLVHRPTLGRCRD